MLKSELKFEKFKKALASLASIYLTATQPDRIVIDATIQRFEFTFELAWKYLKDYFEERGIVLFYPKEILKEAFATQLIQDESLWIGMLQDRNLTSHSYNEKLADEIFHRIKLYVPALQTLATTIENHRITPST